MNDKHDDARANPVWIIIGGPPAIGAVLGAVLAHATHILGGQSNPTVELVEWLDGAVLGAGTAFALLWLVVGLFLLVGALRSRRQQRSVGLGWAGAFFVSSGWLLRPSLSDWGFGHGAARPFSSLAALHLQWPLVMEALGQGLTVFIAVGCSIHVIAHLRARRRAD